ncbi:hypothetical protein [Pikeienuella sp. HZG-20]|uniref:hypothetical protein n=1 Tax=Paludibacillus litoralis TaxID=3133267 RepID=UPI0030ED6965
MSRAWPRRAAMAACCLLAAATAAADGGGGTPGYGGVGLFEMPGLVAAERNAARIAASGDIEGATALIDQLRERHRGAARLHADGAVLAAATGDREGALAALTLAIPLGLPDVDALLARPPLNQFINDPRVTALLADAPAAAAPKTPAPTRVDNGEARVSAANTVWSPADGRLLSRFEMLDAMRRYPVADGELSGPLATLQTWVARGRAAGNVGDLYDNRDDGHSALSRKLPTQISHVVYGPEARAAGVHYGLNTQILFNRITIGNSSTALNGPLWRSQARLALTSADGPAGLAQLYRANHLYVFPEHRDYDPEIPPSGAKGGDATPGHGDLFPANTPYMLVSQGSSHSDIPLLEAARAILAAFPPNVKAFLEERGLIAPMIQQVFRRGQRGVDDAAAYLSAKAHPVVFDPGRIDLARIIAIANSLKVEEIPPVARLRVESEDTGGRIPGLIGGAAPGEERLFDTPSAVARVWRGAGFTRRYILTAADTLDPNGRALRFHWRLTQGDETRVSIRPLDERGTRVEITLEWAPPSPTALRPDVISPRVDIALIADNGAEFSAPAFFSMLYPAHEDRVYQPDPARPGAARLIRIDHTAARKERRYVDPLIWPLRDWSDRLDYAPDGRLLGWERSRRNVTTHFTAHGLLIRDRDAAGRPLHAEAIAYTLARNPKGASALNEEPTGRLFVYRYDGPDDRIGKPEAAPE